MSTHKEPRAAQASRTRPASAAAAILFGAALVLLLTGVAVLMVGWATFMFRFRAA